MCGCVFSLIPSFFVIRVPSSSSFCFGFPFFFRSFFPSFVCKDKKKWLDLPRWWYVIAPVLYVGRRNVLVHRFLDAGCSTVCRLESPFRYGVDHARDRRRVRSLPPSDGGMCSGRWTLP